MFADTLTLPHADGNITVSRIKGPSANDFSSEYLYKGTLFEVSVKIRHSKTAAKSDKPAMDRHNVEMVQTTYATASIPQFTRKVYCVAEQLPSDTDSKLLDCLADYLNVSGVLGKLFGWES